MTTDYNSAYDLITTELQAYWAANVTSIVTPAPEVRFYNNEKGATPATYFIRFQMKPVHDAQSSFRQQDGQRFRASGLIVIEVFGPRKDRQAYKQTRKLSVLLQKRFRRAIDCISFYNVRINDLPAEDAFVRQNVIAEYAYDEIQTG